MWVSDCLGWNFTRVQGFSSKSRVDATTVFRVDVRRRGHGPQEVTLSPFLCGSTRTSMYQNGHKHQLHNLSEWLKKRRAGPKPWIICELYKIVMIWHVFSFFENVLLGIFVVVFAVCLLWCWFCLFVCLFVWVFVVCCCSWVCCFSVGRGSNCSANITTSY